MHKPILATALAITALATQAQEKRELYRMEEGSFWSDGSSTLAGDSAKFTVRDRSTLLEVDSGRPVYRVVEALQTRYAVMITYEDPPYTHPDDLQDVTSKVVRNYSQRTPGPVPRVIVPMGGVLSVQIPTAPHLTSRDLAAVLQQLVEERTPRGGHFRVEQAGDVFHVIPTEVRDGSGNWAPQGALLDTAISLPAQERTEKQLYSAITSAVTGATHTKVALVVNGGILMGVSSEHRSAQSLPTTIEATQEPARSVLMRALALHQTRRTWALLCSLEGGQKVCVLNIWDFPTQAQLTSPAPADLPAPHQNATNPAAVSK
jgi:hypothetical protein